MIGRATARLRASKCGSDPGPDLRLPIPAATSAADPQPGRSAHDMSCARAVPPCAPPCLVVNSQSVKAEVGTALDRVAVLFTVLEAPSLVEVLAAFEHAFIDKQAEAHRGLREAVARSLFEDDLKGSAVPIAARHPRCCMNFAAVEHTMDFVFHVGDLGRRHSALPESKVALERHFGNDDAPVIKVD
jgi:hypothetical protein